jgi:WD40 repeat protein
LWSSDANNTILVWDLNQQDYIQTITGFNTDIWRFAVQPNGHIVTVGGTEHTLGLWALEGKN